MWEVVLPGFFAACALGFAVLAVVWWVRASRQRRWPGVEGRVTDVEIDPGGENGPYEILVIAYRDGRGQQQVHRAGRRREQGVGDVVALRVHPGRGERAVVVGTEREVVWGALAGVVAMLGAAWFCTWIIEETTR